jgi:hypothetical protein
MRGVAMAPIESNQLGLLYLDNDFAMNFNRVAFITGNQNSDDWYATVLGGIFTTPPAVVAPTQNRLDVFGLGLDYSVYHKTCIMG